MAFGGEPTGYYATCSCGWSSDFFTVRFEAVNWAEAHQDDTAPDNGPPVHTVRIVQAFTGNFLRGGH